MKYADNTGSLQALYRQKGLLSRFDIDNIYLERAYTDINQLWLDNFKEISKVNYLMVPEAPLWGQVKKYIYNPLARNSQFFHRSDLSYILDIDIADKQAFLKHCNNIGLLVIDISPFALNPEDTEINYRKLTPSEYRQLVLATIPTYFEKKVKLIAAKKSKNLRVFFRYSRVKDRFEDLLARVFIDKQFIKSKTDIGYISQKGGGIDKRKLRQIITV